MIEFYSLEQKSNKTNLVLRYLNELHMMASKESDQNWQNFQHLGNFKGLIYYLTKNYARCREKKFVAVNGQMLNKQSGRLITLYSRACKKLWSFCRISDFVQSVSPISCRHGQQRRIHPLYKPGVGADRWRDLQMVQPLDKVLGSENRMSQVRFRQRAHLLWNWSHNWVSNAFSFLSAANGWAKKVIFVVVRLFVWITLL